MRRTSLRRLAPIHLLLLAATALPAAEASGDSAGAFAGAHGTNPLETAYRRWAARQSEDGDGRRLVLRLGWSKAFSREPSSAAGRVEVDLAANLVAVEVAGLEAGGGHEVWLVDNLPGPGRSAMPEEGDRMMRVGALEGDGRRAALEARLAQGSFDGFEVDQVVVTPAGANPAESGVLFGSPTLFQRRLRSASFPPMDELVIRGADLFFNEDFDGNGRTCGTCHPAENNFTVDPRFIATLPPRDPLFVAEFVEALAENFENPVLMRGLGLILENTNGFDDLENGFTMRGVPHTLGMSTSLLPAPPATDGSGLRSDRTSMPPDERTGWSGDGSPGSGTLREFANGAVRQHFTRTLGRVAGEDFRFPTDEELDAMEAFQLFLGRDEDVDVNALIFRSPVVARGRDIFMTADTGAGAAGKCNLCHANAGASSGTVPGGFNFNFSTGVAGLPDQPAHLLDPGKSPPDDGFGLPGNPASGTFNTPPIIEAADTGPFFHNNSVETIEGAVAFYNSNAFNDSPSGRFLASIDPNGTGIALETTQVVAVAAFLRVLNALENIRSATEYLDLARKGLQGCGTARCRIDHFASARNLLRLARAEIADAREVLDGGGLHPAAVKRLDAALELARAALASTRGRDSAIAVVLRALAAARAELIEA
jgi:cytochrome c peroxidase